MTERLYNKDSYIRSFHANVVSVTPHNDKVCKVVLDRTAFFPEGGGQSADTGHLSGWKVIDVQEKEEVVIHFVECTRNVATNSTDQDEFMVKLSEESIADSQEQGLRVGVEVQGVLDWEKRFDKMQQHTAEHIASGIIDKLYGYRNVGFHLNDEIVTMDYDGPLTRRQADELEVKVNEAVFANTKIIVSYPSKMELEEILYRSKIEIEGQVRIVEVEGYDICACCAPHVATTGEVGLVKFTEVQSHRGGVRITMVCGRRALLDYQKKSEQVKGVSVLLSAKETQIISAVERLKEELQMNKSSVWSMQNSLVEYKISRLTGEEKQIIEFEEVLDTEHIREYANRCVQMGISLVAIFAGNEEHGYQYIISSDVQDVRIIGKYLNETCNGRGGGKEKMVQGSVKATKETVQKALLSC